MNDYDEMGGGSKEKENKNKRIEFTSTEKLHRTELTEANLMGSWRSLFLIGLVPTYSCLCHQSAANHRHSSFPFIIF